MLRWGTRKSRLYHIYVEREAAVSQIKVMCYRHVDELLIDAVKAIARLGDLST